MFRHCYLLCLIIVESGNVDSDAVVIADIFYNLIENLDHVYYVCFNRLNM